MSVLLRDMPNGDYAQKREFRVEFIKSYGDDWVKELGGQIGKAGKGVIEDLDVITDFAWTAREEGCPTIANFSPSDLALIEDDYQRWVHSILVLQGARFDFNYQLVADIVSVLDNIPTSLNRAKELDVFRVFADLANFEIEADGVQLGSLVKNRSLPYKLKQLLLHGMWLSPSGGYADELIEVSNRALRERPDDAVTYLRVAEGYRRNKDYDRALKALDEGVRIHHPSDIKLMDDFIRQRQLTIQERDVEIVFREASARLEEKVKNLGARIEEYGNGIESHKQDLAAELDHRYAELGEVVEENAMRLREEQYNVLFKIIEILSLFLAIVGIFATSISMATIGNLLWWHRILIIAASSLIFVLFITFVHVLLMPMSEKSGRRKEKEGKRVARRRV